MTEWLSKLFLKLALWLDPALEYEEYEDCDVDSDDDDEEFDQAAYIEDEI